MQTNTLFSSLSFNLPIEAVLSGLAEGTVHRGQSGIAVRCGHRHYLAGEDPAFEAAYCAEFLVGLGSSMFVLCGEEALLQRLAQGPLAERYPLLDWRGYYALDTADAPPPQPLLAGYALVPVDAALLARQELAGLDDLREEMVSERVSVADFLARSFGLALLHGDELVGWCLSEYNTATRCEVGIGVAEGHRRQGLATCMARTFGQLARQRGIEHIGWHCWRSNQASANTALAAGYQSVCAYPVLFGYGDNTLNLAVNGNMCLRRGEAEAAVSWFGRAFAAGNPVWALLPATRACLRSGDAEQARVYLQRALDSGAVDGKTLADDPELADLL